MKAATAAPADGGTDALIEASDCARRSEVAGNEAGGASLFRKLDPALGIAGPFCRNVELVAENGPEVFIVPAGCK